MIRLWRKVFPHSCRCAVSHRYGMSHIHLERV